MTNRRKTFAHAVLIAACVLAAASCARIVNFDPATAPVTEIPATRAAPAARPDTLRVVAFNIQYGEKIAEAVAQLASDPDLRDADALLLQELDTIGVERIAAALGWNAVYMPASIHSAHGREFGNAVLSRWPLSPPRMIPLPHTQPFLGQRRAALAATADVAGTPVLLVSVHLEVPVLGTFKRAEQMAAVVAAVDGVDGPVIVGGDFNTIVDRDALILARVLRRAGFREARGQGPTAKRGVLFWKFQSAVLDHVFGRGLEPVRAGAPDDTDASDHLPVWSLWTWPDDGPRR